MDTEKLARLSEKLNLLINTRYELERNIEGIENLNSDVTDIELRPAMCHTRRYHVGVPVYNQIKKVVADSIKRELLTTNIKIKATINDLQDEATKEQISIEENDENHRVKEGAHSFTEGHDSHKYVAPRTDNHPESEGYAVAD